MADILASDFEGATPFSAWTSAAATVTQNTSIYQAGAASAKHDASTATAPVLTETIAGSPTVLVGQFWFYVPSTTPGYDWRQAQVQCSFFNAYVRLRADTNVVTMRLEAGGAPQDQTGSFADNTWTRITFRLNVSANPITCDWNLGVTEMTQVTFAGGPTDITGFKLGSQDLAASLIAYSDDVRLSTTTGDYTVYKGATTTAPRMALLGVG